MQNFSSQTYKHAGKKFAFTVQIGVKDAAGNVSGSYFANENVISFTYQNKMNQLFLTCEMLVKDNLGIVDQYIEKPFVFLEVQHIRQISDKDGGIDLDTPSDEEKFQQDFYVTSIQVIERKGHEIYYKVLGVGMSWFNLNSYVKYSNYDKDPEEVIKLIGIQLTQCGLKLTPKTFDEIKSPVKIQYMTKQNDTAMSAIEYLLNKLYYYQDKDLSLKFLVYNEMTNKVQVFDLANCELNNGSSTVIISLFKTQTEILASSEPISLGTVVKMPKSNSFKIIVNHPMTGYSLDTNEFVANDIQTDQIIDYKNKRPNSATLNDYTKRFSNFKTTKTYQECGTYWNNELHIYEDSINELLEDNAFVINVDGDMLRKPGAYVVVDVDRDDLTMTQSDEVEELAKTKQKYKGIEGLWIVGSVRHIIAPSAGKYKQNLVLFRNFVQKPAS